MEAILIFFAVPIIFVLVLRRLITHCKSPTKGKAKYRIFRGIGVFGLIITLLVCGAAIFMIVSAFPPFCSGSGCQAGGFLYLLIATPVAIFSFIVSEIFYYLGSITADESEP